MQNCVCSTPPDFHDLQVRKTYNVWARDLGAMPKIQFLAIWRAKKRVQRVVNWLGDMHYDHDHLSHRHRATRNFALTSSQCLFGYFCSFIPGERHHTLSFITRKFFLFSFGCPTRKLWAEGSNSIESNLCEQTLMFFCHNPWLWRFVTPFQSSSKLRKDPLMHEKVEVC